MKTQTCKWILSAISIAITSSTMAASFGGDDDVAFAHRLWSTLLSSNMVGPGRIISTPYTGIHPHGAILDTIDSKVSVDGKNNIVMIKNNYGGEGISKGLVADDPAKYLQAVTVMYKRKGYDPDNADWFWVKFNPGGDVLKNPQGVALAGRVAKGMNEGCIACHKGAPGGDLVFNHNRYAR